jgi:hypothetical protein
MIETHIYYIEAKQKTEDVQKYQEMLESREALISATGFALDHVIEQAKVELANLYNNSNSNSSNGKSLNNESGVAGGQ